MAFHSNYLGDRTWWASHLHETAARGLGDDDKDLNEYLEEFFGTTIEDLNHFFVETLMLDEEYGYWPQIHIGLPHGHVVSVVYFGTPRHEVEYRYSSPSGESFVIALESGNHMLNGFRWTEVKAISALVPQIAPFALLVLTPAADISAQEEANAKIDIAEALSHYGYSSAICSDFAAILVEGLRSDIEWYFDKSYGWVTDNPSHHVRCSPRHKHGQGMPIDNFLALKNFTNDLGINPPSER